MSCSETRYKTTFFRNTGQRNFYNFVVQKFYRNFSYSCASEVIVCQIEDNSPNIYSNITVRKTFEIIDSSSSKSSEFGSVIQVIWMTSEIIQIKDNSPKTTRISQLYGTPEGFKSAPHAEKRKPLGQSTNKIPSLAGGTEYKNFVYFFFSFINYTIKPGEFVNETIGILMPLTNCVPYFPYSINY